MTTKKEILKAIRKHCLDCCGNFAPEVLNCAVGEKCELYPYRMGKDPNPNVVKAEQAKKNLSK